MNENEKMKGQYMRYLSIDFLYASVELSHSTRGCMYKHLTNPQRILIPSHSSPAKFVGYVMKVVS